MKRKTFESTAAVKLRVPLVTTEFVIAGSGDDCEFCCFVDTAGLTTAVAADGKTVNPAYADGRKFRLPAPLMTDARGDKSSAVTYALTPLIGGVSLITVTADREWLKSCGREFPVTVHTNVRRKE